MLTVPVHPAAMVTVLKTVEVLPCWEHKELQVA
jgi:hypothetical protein